MGKGRAPCCDKEKVKRGPWSPAEDLRLITFIQKHGHDNWRALPKQAGLLRCGKSCRLRWINYLRPDVKRGNFSKEEEETIIRLHETLGNKWSKIASHLAGRTDNEIKNVWNTHLKKRLMASKNGTIPNKDESKESSMTSSSSCSSITFMSSSSGKRNLEVELEQQWDEGSVTTKSGEAFPMAVSDKTQDFKKELSNHSSQSEEPKELSSSSISSNNSNNSNTTNFSQVDVSNPGNHQSDSIFNFIEVYDANNTSEEVNKPEMSDTGFDIPFESDLDFWNMLDSLGSFQSDVIQSNEVEGNPSSNFGEAENSNWLHYLENELGLEVTKNENQDNLSKDAAEPLVTKMSDKLPKPVADMGMGHYHIWPSSPHNFCYLNQIQ